MSDDTRVQVVAGPMLYRAVRKYCLRHGLSYNEHKTGIFEHTFIVIGLPSDIVELKEWVEGVND